MFSQVLASLSRLIPRSPQIVVATSDSEHESGWHTSSWELAQGLEVIEITAADGKPSVFADTLPAWYPPRRRRHDVRLESASQEGRAMVKAVWNGVVIAESDDTVVVEGNHYFPESSVKREYLTFSNHRTSGPKGQAHYHSLLVNGELNPDAAWYYPEPSEPAAQIKGRIAFWKGVQVG